MKSLSLSEVSKYSKGKVDEGAKKIIIDSVSTDSRKLKKALFLWHWKEIILMGMIM